MVAVVQNAALTEAEGYAARLAGHLPGAPEARRAADWVAASSWAAAAAALLARVAVVAATPAGADPRRAVPAAAAAEPQELSTAIREQQLTGAPLPLPRPESTAEHMTTSMPAVAAAAVRPAAAAAVAASTSAAGRQTAVHDHAAASVAGGRAAHSSASRVHQGCQQDHRQEPAACAADHATATASPQQPCHRALLRQSTESRDARACCLPMRAACAGSALHQQLVAQALGFHNVVLTRRKRVKAAA